MSRLIQGLLSKIDQVRDAYSSNENIKKIGIGLKEVAGIATQEVAYRFYVEKKLAPSNLTSKDLIPLRLNGALTDVIEIGNIESLGSVSTSPAVNQERYRRRGIRGGVCIRNEHFDNNHRSGFGTLGILARRISDNRLVGLTCTHVANNASDSPTQLDTRIGQPRYWTSCCCCPGGLMGVLRSATLNSELDCALIEIDEDVEEHVISNFSENKIVDFEDDIVGVAMPVLGSFVKKYGQATGLTIGRVDDIAYGPDQMVIKLVGNDPNASFAHHGDSGAVIVNETNQVVGMLVAALQESNPTGKLPLTRGIATFIKPIMQELNISIAGVTADQVTTPIASSPWIGGQTDPSLNPIEIITSNDMLFSGNVDWDISTGMHGAVIIETNSQIAIGLSHISVRYDSVSASSSNDDAVIIIATKDGVSETRYRTVVKITPELNVGDIKHSLNTLNFMLGGGFNNKAGAYNTATEIGANDLYLAKAEIIYNISPADVQWNSQIDLDFVYGSGAGILGQIISRRETKYNKGRQRETDPHRIHTEQTTWILEPDVNADDVQFPSDSQREFLFRMANYWFDPAELIQAYDRADYRDYLAFYNGNDWIRITPYADWHSNLTAEINPAGETPLVGEINEVGLGESTALIPNDPPSITLPNTEVEINVGDPIMLEAESTDPNNDAVELEWEQLSGPNLGWTDNKIRGNNINIPTNDTGGLYRFKVIGDDGTGNLSRLSGNNLSEDELIFTVKVVEWKQRFGGHNQDSSNQVEEFRSEDFGFSGAMNWDVTGGAVTAEIIEKDGSEISPIGTVTNASTIKVRYNNHSSDGTVGQAVHIQITDPTDITTLIIKRNVMKVTFTLLNTGAMVTSPEFEDYQNTLLGTGGINQLGPAPMGRGRSDYHNTAYTAIVLVMAEVIGHMPTTVFRWRRLLRRRSWKIIHDSATSVWNVTQRTRRGIPPFDDTGSDNFNDATPSALSRMYISDNSALALQRSVNGIQIGDYVNEEKDFTYIIQFHDGTEWKDGGSKRLGQILTAKKINITGFVFNDWLGIENSTAFRILSSTIDEVEVRAIVGGNDSIVIDPTANN